MADFGFYEGVYLGRAIPEREFPGLASRAKATLDRFRRVYRVTVPDEDSLKMAICAMAETLDYFEKAQNGTATVQSVSVGSVSTSYGNMAAGIDLSPKALEKELYRCACQYLDIYRGVG